MRFMKKSSNKDKSGIGGSGSEESKHHRLERNTSGSSGAGGAAGGDRQDGGDGGGKLTSNYRGGTPSVSQPFEVSEGAQRLNRILDESNIQSSAIKSKHSATTSPMPTIEKRMPQTPGAPSSSLLAAL